MRKIFTAFIVIVNFSCSQKANTPANIDNTEVPVVKVVSQQTEINTSYVANIKAIRHTEIRSRVNGFLEKALVDEGSFVKAGQPMFQLTTGEYRIAVAKAEAVLASALAEAKTAELEMERIVVLVDKNVITKTEKELAKAKIEMAEARISEAKASLEEAKLNMNFTLIRAPFSGILNKIDLRLGSLIEEGTLLTTLSDVSSVFAYFNVSENDYLAFNNDLTNEVIVEKEVGLILSNGLYFSEKGKIETTEGEFDESTGAIAFRARFGNPNNVLKHGATGKVVINSQEASSLVIPQKAVFEIQDKYYVFVVDSNGIIKQRSFIPKVRLNEGYVVASGLKEGETIVYEGVQNLRDGSVITTKEISLANSL